MHSVRITVCISWSSQRCIVYIVCISWSSQRCIVYIVCISWSSQRCIVYNVCILWSSQRCIVHTVYISWSSQRCFVLQSQVRVGQLQVYQLDVGHSNPAQSLSHGDPAQSLSHGDPAQSLSHGDPTLSLSHGDPTLSLSHCLDMPGILDIKWARQRLGTAALCGLVNAKGQLQLWALEDEGSVMGAGGSVMGAGGSVMGAGGSVMGVEERRGRGPVVPRPVKTVEIAECIGLSLDWATSGEGYSSLTSTRLSPPSPLLSPCLKTSLKEQCLPYLTEGAAASASCSHSYPHSVYCAL